MSEPLSPSPTPPTADDALAAALSSVVAWALEETAELHGAIATADAASVLDAVLDLSGVTTLLRVLAASAAGHEGWASAVSSFDEAQRARGRNTPAFAAANRVALSSGLDNPAVLDDALRMVEARLASPKDAPLRAIATTLLPGVAAAKRAATAR